LSHTSAITIVIITKDFGFVNSFLKKNKVFWIIFLRLS